MQLASLARKALLFANSRYMAIRHVGKISGESFIIRKPSLVRISGGGRLVIGQNSVIEKGARIVAYANITIGDNVYIGKNSTLISFAPLSIGNNTLIGENVSIHTEDHGPAGARENYTYDDISIGNDVWVGAGSVILKGVAVGSGSTIGANSVVKSSIDENTLVAGVPATFKKRLDKNA